MRLHKPWPLLRGRDSASRTAAVRSLVNPRFHVSTCLAPRSITVVLGLGTRLRVHMRTTFENGVLHNGHQPSSAVNSSIDQGEFRAMKTLSDRIALCCDKYQFCDKMTVNT